ncbi:TNF receptor-associated factor 4-like isoform X4 [Oculina patagonica]
MIFCPYERMGCETKVRRNQVESHLQSAVRLHLDLACIKLNNTEVKLNDTQMKLETTTKLVEEFNTRMFILKINNFSEILRQAKTEEKYKVESPPFYTERSGGYGYKLKVKLFPNGDESGKNTHLSVVFVVMKGAFDAILPWPFKKKVKFTLIDQQEDSVERENVDYEFIPGNYPACFARPTQEKGNSGFGSDKFISHEQLHSRRYLVDDTLFLQVEVGPRFSCF